MTERASYEIITAKGIAEAGQDKALADLKTRLAGAGTKVLLHLHGGWST